ncbi:hypothetical protein Q5V20_004355 [Vibrio parahaemolyticus]|nr:hypothetical protein [Vibrio parahaemolyticus]ELA7884179.1 hypothetical protein [Vibrio parahaemolyticus]ELA7892630.1 hypothetical protein [Vibrio parahaemolyticus]ELB2110556.1 hypothetical protein [Vibrio parahaemolyticus]MDF4741821.1 hypothetical protein [Vibrio parahaemolyticus]
MHNNIKKVHLEARKAILDYLEEVGLEPSSSRKFTGRETSFEIDDISDLGTAKREIFFGALKELVDEGLVCSESGLGRLPIYGLKLTPKGIMRAKNPIEVWREEGIKSAISASLNAFGRYLQSKFDT